MLYSLSTTLSNLPKKPTKYSSSKYEESFLAFVTLTARLNWSYFSAVYPGNLLSEDQTSKKQPILDSGNKNKFFFFSSFLITKTT